jgi:ABC-2 type transport system permease protein
MNATLLIAKREFRSYFDSPIAYVVLILSLFVVGILYFQSFWTVNQATIGPLFTYMPWMFIFLVPAMTMRLFAEEKRTGTIELLMTMPVRDREVVLGKFFGAVGLIVVLLLLTLTYPLSIGRLGDLDNGPLVVGYLGLLLEAGAALAIGIWASTLTENQIVAMFIAGVLMMVLFIIDYLFATWTGIAGDIVGFISFQRRLMPFSRGLLDLRNAVYFLSVTAFFLTLATRSLESRKWK